MKTITESENRSLYRNYRIQIESILKSSTQMKVSRKCRSGLSSYFKGSKNAAIYSKDEALRLSSIGVEDRMKVKISEYYELLVMGGEETPPSEPLRALITARDEEVEDLSGEADPSSQLCYSLGKGILHKYEMILIYVVKTCSAHCRYCYRLDLFTGKTGKKTASPTEAVDYIHGYNNLVNKEKRIPINEVLLSGGDPMVLTNKKISEWLGLIAQTGVRSIRIGTKELAFRPQRFDAQFFEILDCFHENFPAVRIVFCIHFTHPDEFLSRGRNGDYIPESRGSYKWMTPVIEPLRELTQRRHFISVENQTPIIKFVNDDASILKILQRELYHKGVGNHYLFQCRRIEGHKAFALPIEHTLYLFNESRRELSGVESHAKLVMSTKVGKIEIVGEMNNYIVFRVLRSPDGNAKLGAIAFARKNPNALWIDDYANHVESDPENIISQSNSSITH